jgi:geranylgeranyl diphosphate synthase type II
MNIEFYKELFLKHLESKKWVKQPKNLYEPIDYILQLGGKRLRPVIVLMICDLFDEDPKKALDAALAVEVFHNFTLIHDDIMDSAPIRRGKKTVHIKWDVNTGILSGDAMMILAYQCIENYEPGLFKKLNVLFSKTALEVCEGQQLDMDFETRNDVDLAEYLTMIINKTSVLVAAAMKMGATIANATEQEAEAIYNYGLNLGIAFQLQDDYLDTFGNQEVFGKQIGGDIRENKKTFLYLKALELTKETEREKLVSLYNSNESKNKVEIVTDLFKKYKIDKLVIDEIENYTFKAFENLKSLSLPEKKISVLKEFGSNLMKRTL